MSDFDIVVVGGGPGGYAAALYAASAGQKVAMSMSDPFCVDRHRGEFGRMVSEDLDVVFGNAEELRSLMQVDDLEEACRRVRRPGLLVSVTLGPDTCRHAYAAMLPSVSCEPVPSSVTVVPGANC